MIFSGLSPRRPNISANTVFTKTNFRRLFCPEISTADDCAAERRILVPRHRPCLGHMGNIPMIIAIPSSTNCESG